MKNTDRYAEAKGLVFGSGRVSFSYLHRVMGIPNTLAVHFIERMEDEQFVSIPDASGTRKVLAHDLRAGSMMVVIYGPMECGKTRNAEALAAHFGLRIIVDDWDPRWHRLTPGALHLSHQPYQGLEARSISFIGLKFDPDARGTVTHQRPLELRSYTA